MNDYRKTSVDERLPPPLPTTQAELHTGRKVKMELTLNDHVEVVYLAHGTDEDLNRLLWGTTDAQCKEGSITADNHEAARFIRDRAEEMGNPAKDENLTSIRHALGVVLRRWNRDRKYRRNMIHGEQVPSTSDNGEF